MNYLQYIHIRTNAKKATNRTQLATVLNNVRHNCIQNTRRHTLTAISWPTTWLPPKYVFTLSDRSASVH